MSKMYTGLVNLSKIDKDLVITTKKNGEPFKDNAKMLPVTIWVNDEPDAYGNTMSINIGGKDKKIYIANLKEFVREDETPTEKPEDNDLPF